MATFTQGADPRQTAAIFALEGTGRIAPVPTIPTLQGFVADAISPDSPGDWTASSGNKSTKTPAEFAAERAGSSSGGFDWFETFHVVPRSFDFGNLLSDQSTPIEVFNAFRRLPQREWTSFTNNAGAGTSLGGAPSLPTLVDPLSGVPMTVDVSTNGAAFVDATLDFFFSGVGTAYVPIVIQRIVLWGLIPELPYAERLGFLSDVRSSKDGSEQRASLRKNPRQSWAYEYVMEEGVEAQILENLLFDFQARTFGVPVWDEDSEVTVAVAAGDTTITVNDTAWRNYRDGGLVAIFQSQSVFDVLEIDVGGITPTTITVTSPTVNAYSIGTKVFPLATCMAPALISGERYPVGLRRARIRFEASDNDVDLADLTPFSSYNGKLFLDLGNSMIRGNVGQQFQQDLVRIDGGTGLVFQDSNWDRNKRLHQLTIRADGRQAIWELRGLAHALRGRTISFYVPTDSDDLVAVADLLSASNLISVTNVGFAQFVRQRAPKNAIRVNFVDGSTPLLRAVTASTSVSASVDQLTVDTNWPSTITPAEISRIEYVEKVRLASDDVEIQHDASGSRARLIANVQAVFE